MARITREASHHSEEEIKTRLKRDPRLWCRQRWLIIYNALVDPRDARDIAKHTGTRVSMVHQVIAAYNHLGVAAVETPGKGGLWWLLPTSIRTSSLQKEYKQHFAFSQGRVYTADECKTS